MGKITCINNEIDPSQPFTLSNEGNEEVMGSCFSVRSSSIYLPRENCHKRYMITNAHVIEGASTKTGYSSPLRNAVIWGNVILACKALDFAIIEVTAEHNLHL